MLADFFTKALQGSLFTKFKKVIMGEEHVSTLKKPSLAPAKERVENRDVFENGKDLVSGANGQAIDDVTETHVSKTYASVLKRGEWTKSINGVKFAPLSRGKSRRAHSIE